MKLVRVCLLEALSLLKLYFMIQCFDFLVLEMIKFKAFNTL